MLCNHSVEGKYLKAQYFHGIPVHDDWMSTSASNCIYSTCGTLMSMCPQSQVLVTYFLAFLSFLSLLGRA